MAHEYKSLIGVKPVGNIQPHRTYLLVFSQIIFWLMGYLKMLIVNVHGHFHSRAKLMDFTLRVECKSFLRWQGKQARGQGRAPNVQTAFIEILWKLHISSYINRKQQKIAFIQFISNTSLEQINIEIGASWLSDIIIIMHVWEDNYYQETKMTKILILECLDLNFTQQFQIELPYDYENRELDLSHPLAAVLQTILHIQCEHQVFYFHPINHHYVYAGIYPFKDPIIIGEDFINAHEITVRVRRLGSEVQNLGEEKEKEKKRRVGERTIRQVLQKVSEWREINQKNPKITLDQAARMLEIPKKTLDDYYMHIKIASEHQFPFTDNLNQKIGVLRKFVRDKHMKKKELELQFLPSLLKKPKKEEQWSQEEQEQ